MPVSRWSEFVEAEPELAAFATERLQRAVAYLATVRSDAGPRLHPVGPLIRAGGLYLFMEPTSPKRRDLLGDPRYALHAGVEDNEGGGGELAIRGRAVPVDDPVARAEVASKDTPERYVLFELTIDRVLTTTYADTERVQHRWVPDSPRVG